MVGRLDGKVAVITGGASGIGRATALRFLAEGARVVVGDLNGENGAGLVAEVAAGEAAGRLSFQLTNVAEEADIEALIARARSDFGQLDCLFNNAGVGGAVGPISEIAVEDWDYTFEVMVRGVFLGMKHGSKEMRRQGRGGSIISTASIAALSANSGPTAYSAAKCAVVNLTKSAAVELAADRIRVNAIAPGIISTPLLYEGDASKIPQRMLAKQPWPDVGQPEHIAGVALFLASDDAVFVSGETIVTDGALSAAGPNLWGGAGENVFLRSAGVNRGDIAQVLG